MARRTAVDALRRALARLGWEIEPANRHDPFRSLLRRRIHREADFFFVQIGASDGKLDDPIYRWVVRHRLHGLVVEPLPDVFTQLAANYAANPEVTPVNAAIHATERETTLYRVDPCWEEAPTWAKGIASFDPGHHEKSGIPAERMRAERVRCMTLRELCAGYGVARIDLLQIDTEGYDCEIVRMIDFETMSPRMIRFEHRLEEGVMSREAFAEILDLLYGHGYEILIERHDAVAYLPEPRGHRRPPGRRRRRLTRARGARKARR